MSDYNSGYDPKYGYNRNAFAHETLGTAVMGQVVKMIVTPIGLVSEAVHALKDKRRPSSDAAPQEAGLNPSTAEGASSKKEAISTEDQAERKDSAYVNVPPAVADELIASGQAEPTDRQAPSHELVSDDKEDDDVDRDEADWAVDEATAEGEDEQPPRIAKWTRRIARRKLHQPLARPPEGRCKNSPFQSSSPNVAPAPNPVASYVHTRPSSKKLVFLKTHS